ncbi:carboxypeptidase-like regulatory domain-containing protein [uncultured Prevotella sp.]|uniref:carboxypeptidase-like regulatory domain-containing protein n=1 Tax=uncultured Prevotella sp. TaxID=159272 RepID=UPI002615F14C|nr:carboxypeptidase-like regulatory domain-containing protein [uncultured Prevotella sp.]
MNYILTLLLLAVGATWAMADDHTLSLGNYDEVVAGDWNEDQCYQGSWWMVTPTQFNVKHTGSQFIYTKEQLAQMAGKEIKGMSFVFYNQGAFKPLPRTVNVWVKEIDDNAFAYSAEKKAYSYFEYGDAAKVLSDYAFDTDFVDYYCLNGELELAFTSPFAYSGNKNLLVTITFDGDNTSDTPSDIEFYYNTGADKMAMVTCSDKTTFADYNESEDWPYATGGGSAISHGDKLAQPLTKFTYQEASKPVVKPAELAGTVKCGETPIAGATVTLTSGETKYEAETGAEGKYTMNIEAENIDKEYTLTAKAEGYEDYKSAEPVKFASDEKKTLDISMTKKDVPSVLSGKVLFFGDNTPVKNAVITVKNDNNKYSATSNESGEYTVSIVKSEETYTLTAKADDFEDYVISNYTFTPGEPKTQNITMRKIEHPSVMTGTVTCDGEPVDGAIVKLTATDDSKLLYKATTGAEGTYVINVVKSDKTYTLKVTCGGCEDYTEENITFTPGKDMTKNIAMTKTPEPENSVTLGKYDKMLADGTEDNVYVGHGYSWAAAPTNFSHSKTGSQIIYTKEQLAKMGGKAISKVNFIFHNECAYETYPRTVKVWAQEIDDTNFGYDDKSGLYMFYDYNAATEAVAGMEYAGELYNYIGNGELEIPFDKPLNYSGNKNLLLTITFEGTGCCNTLDFNFFCNPDMPKKAMTYFSDKFTFDEYAETEDWPYVNDDCTPKLEQPITRFFYTEAQTDGISIVAGGSKAATGSEAIYNLAGQRVGKSYKGIVVKNGRKYVK